jgi:hypothetical protein
MQAAAINELVPAAVAGLQLRRTREQVIRAICRGDLQGARLDGRWYVSRSALPKPALDGQESSATHTVALSNETRSAASEDGAA